MLEFNLASKAKKKGGGAINTYDDFKTFAAANSAKQVSGTSTLDGSNPATKDNTYLAVTLDNFATSNNYGSPWGTEAWWGLNLYRVIQHCAPDLATWNELSGSKRTVLIKVGTRVYRNGGWKAVTRNGWTTAAYTGNTSGWPVLDFIYWDETSGTTRRSNPNAQDTVGTIFDGVLK